MTAVDRAKFFGSLHKLGVYARQHGFEPTFAWTREINPDGTGRTHACLSAHPKAASPPFGKHRYWLAPRDGRSGREAGKLQHKTYVRWQAALGYRIHLKADDTAGMVQARPPQKARRNDPRQTWRRFSKSYREGSYRLGGLDGAAHRSRPEPTFQRCLSAVSKLHGPYCPTLPSVFSGYLLA
jgi:hypothetical protein